MVDWNEDGLKDLLVGEYNGKVRYYRNIGTAGNPELTYDSNLMVGGVEIQVYSYSFPWVNDWDEDGRKDLLVGASDGRIWLYINAGTNANPVFTNNQYVMLESGEFLSFGSNSAPIVVDLDGDGLKDVAGGHAGGIAYFFQNSGSNANPLLTTCDTLKVGVIPINPGGNSRYAPIDWDEDGTIDLVAGSYDARLKLYLQADYTPAAPIVDLTYEGSWWIPTSGDTLNFTLAVANESASALTFDVWSEARLPDEHYFGPLLSRQDISLASYDSLSRDLTQNVPGRAQNGLYFYYGYAGDQSELQIYSSDHFFFHKMDLDGGARVGDWNCAGWDDEAPRKPEIGVSDHISLRASPNPFNSSVTLNFDLPAALRVKITLFDSAGRKVATLLDGHREKGQHQITWEATTLPSGIYLAHLESGSYQAIQKLFVIK